MPRVAPITREAAHRINPLISNRHSGETLENLARLSADLGSILCMTQEIDNPHSDIRLPGVWLICEAIAGALNFEQDCREE